MCNTFIIYHTNSYINAHTIYRKTSCVSSILSTWMLLSNVLLRCRRQQPRINPPLRCFHGQCRFPASVVQVVHHCSQEHNNQFTQSQKTSKFEAPQPNSTSSAVARYMAKFSMVLRHQYFLSGSYAHYSLLDFIRKSII